MREPKRSQKNSPGPGAADQPPSARAPTPNTAGSCGPSPSPSPGQPPPTGRPPRTPKHEALDSPWYAAPPATPKGAVKSEPLPDGMYPDALSNPPSVSMPSPATGGGVLSAASNLIVPSSPLDQFRKEDPMEKMAQMTSSLGTAGGPGSGGGSLLMSLRSPSSLSPGTPHSHIPSPIPNGLSRPSVITQQQQQHYGPGPASMVGSPNPNPNQHQPPPRIGHAAALANQGPTVPEQPYMQQQSVVFVFNTVLANRAAEMVTEGHLGTIIDVHMQEEATKRFLSQHGLKRPAGASSMGGAGLQPGGAGWSPDGAGAGPARHGGSLAGYRPQLAGKGTAQPPPQMLGMGGQAQVMEQPGLPGSVEVAGNSESKQAKLDKLRQMQRKFLPTEEPADMNGMAYAMQMPPAAQPPYTSVPMRPGAGKNAGGAQCKRSGNSARQTHGAGCNASAEQMTRLGNQEMAGMMASPNGSGELGGMADMRLSPGFLYAAEMCATGDGANVMPVPSPQPIQYISGQFDAQELVIQKQPNRSYMRSHAGQAGGEAPMQQQQQPQGHGSMMMHRQATMNGMPRGKNAGSIEQASMLAAEQFADLRGGPMPGYAHSMPGGGGHPSAQQYSQGNALQPSPGPGGTFSDPGFPSGIPQTHQQHHPMPQQPALDPCLNNVRMRGPYTAVPGGGGGHMAYDAPRANLHGDPHSHVPQPHSAPPQTVNNTYVNAHMTIEHVNIQNMPYENTQYSQSHSQSSLSYSAPGMEPVQMARGVSHVQQLSHQQPRPMMDGPAGYPTPYEGPLQIAIKPNAPNTIQYLPSRPPPPKQPRAPPNLDFLQQWTGGPATRPASGMGQPAPFRGPNVHMSVGGGGGGPPGAGMYASMEGSAVNMNINPAFVPQSSSAPNAGMMQMGGPGAMADDRYSSYQDFQQQLYATNVGGSRGTGPPAPGSAAGMAAPSGGGGNGPRGP